MLGFLASPSATFGDDTAARLSWKEGSQTGAYYYQPGVTSNGIGVMGSERRWAATKAKLLEAGIDPRPASQFITTSAAAIV